MRSSPIPPPASRRWGPPRARRRCSNGPDSRSSGVCSWPARSCCARSWHRRCGPGWPPWVRCSRSRGPCSPPRSPGFATPSSRPTSSGRCPGPHCCSAVSRTPGSPCWPGAGDDRFRSHRRAQAPPGGPLSRVSAVVDERIRVVIGKPGLDGHDRGAKVVARALRDAGMEVVYTGLHQTPEQIVETALQEDAQAVGLSILSGAHMTLFTRLMELLRERDATDIVVFGGGIIPADDIPALSKLGVAKVFTPGATTYEIVDWLRAALAAAPV